MKILTCILLTASLLLAACQAAPTRTPQSTLTGGIKTTAPAPTSPAATAYPATAATSSPSTAATSYPASTAAQNPAAGQAGNATGAYPAPTEQTAVGSSFPPQPGDQAMAQQKFFLDSASLQPDQAHPGWTDLMVAGSLPTPCNILRAQVNPPDNQNKIVVNAYSVYPKDKICNQMVQPFSGRIAILGDYPSGKYTVVVNDTTAGELSVP